jgi:hypothetical protein
VPVVGHDVAPLRVGERTRSRGIEERRHGGVQDGPIEAGLGTDLRTWAVSTDSRWSGGEGVESFEQFVAVAMEAEGLIVSEAVKFPVRRQTRKVAHDEVQMHGYEVDLIGARADLLVLATVKSFLGSRGVVAAHVMGTGGDQKARDLNMLLNDLVIRSGVVEVAAKRYGYREDQVRLRLYVGRFAGPVRHTHEPEIRRWAATQIVGGGPIEVYGLTDVIQVVWSAAASKTYRDNPVLVTMKVLDAAGLLVGMDTSGVAAD